MRVYLNDQFVPFIGFVRANRMLLYQMFNHNVNHNTYHYNCIYHELAGKVTLILKNMCS